MLEKNVFSVSEVFKTLWREKNVSSHFVQQVIIFITHTNMDTYIPIVPPQQLAKVNSN